MALPGLVGTDHIGFTVPDLDAGARLLRPRARLHPRLHARAVCSTTTTGCTTHLNVHPRTVMRRAALLPVRHRRQLRGVRVRRRRRPRPEPRNSDIGGHHLAFYVDDIDAAVDYLRAEGIRVLGEPTASRNASEGQRWVYFLSPWGMQFELVSFPNGKAYESDAEVLLWNPNHPAQLTLNGSENPMPHQVRDGVTGPASPTSCARRSCGVLPAGNPAATGGARRAVRRQSCPGAGSAAHPGVRRTGHDGGQHRRVDRPAQSRRMRRAVPGARAHRTAAAALQPAAPGRRTGRPVGRASPSEMRRNRRRRTLPGPGPRSSTWAATRAPKRPSWAPPSSGCGTPPSTTGVRSPGCWTARATASCTTSTTCWSSAIRDGDSDEAERVLLGHIRRTRRQLARHPEVFDISVDRIQLLR